ncbi:MAG TPA: hypothetical protein DDZ40_01910 [Deltaproteobacteria bacterium]|nr:hypothetical protein [Deltaproteobacteria bacterium]
MVQDNKNSGKHPLHEKIGEALTEIINGAADSKIKLVLDPACGGKQNLPIFSTAFKSNPTEYCNVDALVLSDEQVKIIIEIEEANIKPTQICGKYLTSALGRYFIHVNNEKGQQKNQQVGMSEKVSFIQVLDGSKLERQSKKPDQFRNIEKSIQDILPVKGSSVHSYKIIFFENADDKERLDRFKKYLLSCLS